VTKSPHNIVLFLLFRRFFSILFFVQILVLQGKVNTRDLFFFRVCLSSSFSRWGRWSQVLGVGIVSWMAVTGKIFFFFFSDFLLILVANETKEGGVILEITLFTAAFTLQLQ
jgi:hypothetical protein